MSRGARLGIVTVMLLAVLGLVIGTVMAFLRSSPATVDFTANHRPGQPVDMTVQTVGSVGIDAHPTWVSYLVQAPNGRWVHTTLWQLPAHTLVNVSLYEYDSGSPLRNPEIGLIMGVNGGAELLNGKPVPLVDATGGNGVAHTFSIPTLGVNIPLPGVDGSAKNFCAGPAPCTPNQEHNLIQFSFTTPGPGQYPWQCFVPCGLGFLYGNGGPMQTIGYMDGFLKVVA
ncbi:MAG: hypothetical protein JWM85_1988 [Acidimicrobiaceae bacterium]|nr:hypothetical protein [Acidimicrobiaceae bacterium]